MKIGLSLIILSCILLSPLLADKKKLSPEERKKIIYDLNVKRASDLSQAFSSLKAQVGRDHYVSVRFNRNHSVKKNHELVSVQSFGELLNLKFVDFDDKSDFYLITVRGGDISQFYSAEK